MNSKELIAITLCSVAGAGLGYNNAHNDQRDARSRIITVETCKKAYPDVTKKIGRQTLDCLNKGVPGGNKTNTHLEVGDSELLLDAYRQKQVDGTAHIDTNQIVEGAVAGFVLGLIIF